MTEELQERLFKDFPKLFARKEEMKTPYMGTIHCDVGWEKELQTLCEKLRAWNTNNPDKEVVFTHIGKLDAQLRARVDVTNMDVDIKKDMDGVREILNEVRISSSTVCEVCGKTGRKRCVWDADQHFYFCWCEKCDEEAIKRWNEDD